MLGDYHVILYVSPHCDNCQKARQFLENRGINYEEKSIRDPGARGELRYKTGRIECPTIDVDGHIVVGYLPEKWDHLLAEEPLRMT
ncbi:glutaredoxin domain-containing protein [Desulfofundulus sp. TPOSR]|uniref:glutaredoxin family protein n=1 Tax=Desulfofundulus sp. TPOSR TaxID=2714340 RepID=UPI0028BDD484|nr:glutaredoxin domain-containing protein [Desulfofundulus sp. TPOSR]